MPDAPPPRDPDVDLVVEALLAARRTGRPVGSGAFVARLVDDAMALAVQDAVCAALGSPRDPRPRAWKAGAAGPGAPVGASPLPACGIHVGPVTLPGAAFRQRGIEAEIAFRLGRVPRSTPGAGEALAACDAWCVAIEVVDSRWAEGMAAPERLRTADLQSHGALVLGAWQPLRAVDWARQSCEIRVDGQTVLACVGGHACTDPAAVLDGWIAQARSRGHRLDAGDVVTTGSWGPAVWVGPAAQVRVEFAGLGRLDLAFVGGRD